MAACGSLRHIFDSAIPDNSSSSSFIDSLSSCKQIRPLRPHLDHHSFTEIFGELHFKETTTAPVPNSFPWGGSSPVSQRLGGVDDDHKWEKGSNNGYQGSYHKRSDSFSSLNSESLQLCTEGLGSESLDDAENLKVDQGTEISCQKSRIHDHDHDHNHDSYKGCYKGNNSYRMGEKVHVRGFSGDAYRKRKPYGKTFPPPISCIGRTGKPCVCFESYREDGRFVLKEIMIPTHERLHACREDGRLRLSFVQPPVQEDCDEVAEEENNDGGEEAAGKAEEEGDEGENKSQGVEEGEGDEGGENKDGLEEGEGEIEGRNDFEKGHS